MNTENQDLNSTISPRVARIMANTDVDYSIPSADREAVATLPKYTPAPAESPATITDADRAKMYANDDVSARAADPKGYASARALISPHPETNLGQPAPATAPAPGDMLKGTAPVPSTPSSRRSTTDSPLTSPPSAGTITIRGKTISIPASGPVNAAPGDMLRSAALDTPQPSPETANQSALSATPIGAGYPAAGSISTATPTTAGPGHIDSKVGRNPSKPPLDAGPAPGSYLTGATPLPQAGPLAQAGNVDVNGNSTAATQAMQGQLARMQADNASSDAARTSGIANNAAVNALTAPTPGDSYQDRQNADADRFTRFVNESETARLAHDLGTGGHAFGGNDGRVAALNAMQQRDAAARGAEATRVGQLQGASAGKGALAVQSNQQQMVNAQMTKQQQLTHDSAMAHIFGSPLHQQGQMLDNAIKSGQVSQAAALQQIQAKMADPNAKPDDVARYALLFRQLQGKDMQEGKLITVGGGSHLVEGIPVSEPQYAASLVPGQSEPKIWNTNGAQMSPNATALKVPSAAAIDYLKKNPNTRADFEAHFGQGSAKQILGK